MNRIAAGGYPLLLVQLGKDYYVIPGSCIRELRKDPSEDNVITCSSSMWKDDINAHELIEVLTKPKGEYDAKNR
jgi:hypothetical protein